MMLIVAACQRSMCSTAIPKALNELRKVNIIDDISINRRIYPFSTSNTSKSDGYHEKPKEWPRETLFIHPKREHQGSTVPYQAERGPRNAANFLNRLRSSPSLFRRCGWNTAMTASAGSLVDLGMLAPYGTRSLILEGAGCHTLNERICHAYNLDKFLDPKIDVVFCRVFGTEENKKNTISFINNILRFTGENVVEDVEFLNTKSPPGTINFKDGILDIVCKDCADRRFIIKMQVAPHAGFAELILFCAARVYRTQLRASKKYLTLRPVHFISILNFNIDPDNRKYISTHTIRDEESNAQYVKSPSFTFIELPKFLKKKVDELESLQDIWCYYLKYAVDATVEDVKSISKMNETIKFAFDAIDISKRTETEILNYSERKEQASIEESIRAQAYEDGVKEGKIEMVMILLKIGKLTTEEIADSVQFPVHEVEQLKQNLSDQDN